MNRDRLWKAWPDGCLAICGVSTIAGWHCIGHIAGYTPLSWWTTREALWSSGASYFNDARKAGDMLPNVDPADTATWACLLHDLARLRWAEFGEPRPEGTPVLSCDQGDWMLWIYGADGVPHGLCLDSNSDPIATDDLAEALVEAMIRCRGGAV